MTTTTPQLRDLTGHVLTFKSTAATDGAPGHRDRSGQTVRVIRHLTPSEADLDETGPMYRVHFLDDGDEADVFADELVPLPTLADLVGKTVARIRTKPMAAKDGCGDWIEWTATVLTFTDGTSYTFAVDEREVYTPLREQFRCAECDEAIVLIEKRDWLKPDFPTYVHLWLDAHDDDHVATPKPEEN